MKLRLKGRHWLLLWLLVFVAVSAAVVARQSAALATARRLAALKEQRVTLEARRADLERRIRLASGRQTLAEHVEQTLGLHQPSDSEFVLFRVPRRR
jgi:cell division protein FtsB